MRPNWTGWGIVALFLVGGIIFWITIPDIYIGQIWVGVSVLLIGIYTFANKRANRALEITQTGVRGQAQILEMTQLGTRVNGQPRVKFRLLVSAPGTAPFEDERTEIVPEIALGALTNGTPLSIYMKPEVPSDYVIDWFGQEGLVSAVT